MGQSPDPGLATGWFSPFNMRLWGWWGKSHGLCSSTFYILSILLAPSLAGPLRYSNGHEPRARSLPEPVSGKVFSVSEEGTTAICDLSFSVDFSSIQSAEVSCRTLYDLVGAQVNISQTTHDWSFYAAVGGEVYEIDASLTFNPTLETVQSLTLCFSPTCLKGSSSSGGVKFCINYPEGSSSSSCSTISRSSKSCSSSLGCTSSSISSQISSSSQLSFSISALIFAFDTSSSISSSNPEFECLCEELQSSSSSSSKNDFILAFKSSSSSSSSDSIKIRKSSSSSSFSSGISSIKSSSISTSSSRSSTSSRSSNSSSSISISSSSFFSPVSYYRTRRHY